MVFSSGVLSGKKLKNPIQAREFKARQNIELDRETPRDLGPEQLFDDMKELEEDEAPYDWYGKGGRDSKANLNEKSIERLPDNVGQNQFEFNRFS